jgi:hypothetical protein
LKKQTLFVSKTNKSIYIGNEIKGDKGDFYHTMTNEVEGARNRTKHGTCTNMAPALYIGRVNCSSSKHSPSCSVAATLKNASIDPCTLIAADCC